MKKETLIKKQLKQFLYDEVMKSDACLREIIPSSVKNKTIRKKQVSLDSLNGKEFIYRIDMHDSLYFLMRKRNKLKYSLDEATTFSYFIYEMNSDSKYNTWLHGIEIYKIL